MRAGAAAEVGGGPGRGVRPRHPGLEEEESILQPEGRKDGPRSVQNGGGVRLPGRLCCEVAADSGPGSPRPGIHP